jgi:hypothetical protein
MRVQISSDFLLIHVLRLLIQDKSLVRVVRDSNRGLLTERGCVCSSDRLVVQPLSGSGREL